MAGLNILGNQSQIQQNRAFQFMQPSLGQLNASMTTPGQFYQAATYNNSIENINRQIDFTNSQRSSWFDTMLGDTLKGAVGLPFNIAQNAFNVASSAPQMAAGAALSYFGGGGATPFQANFAPGSSYGFYGQAPSQYGGSPFGQVSNMFGSIFNQTAPRPMPN
jgi:hypothetical protein